MTKKPQSTGKSKHRNELWRIESESDFKRFVSRVHTHLRDSDGNSSIIERFDEISKLIVLKMDRGEILSPISVDDITLKDAKRIRDAYKDFISNLPFATPEKYAKINLPDSSLIGLAKFVGKFDIILDSSDLKGLLYEEIVKNTFEKGDNQQFFTPSVIVDFMCSFMSPHYKGEVCDPASGTGGFLINLLKREHPFTSFTAFEIDERLAWTTGLNMHMHDPSKPFQSKYLPDGGSLGAAGRNHLNSFDMIFTNPPFGSDYSEADELDNYVLGKGKKSRRRGVLFIERCLEMLREGGHLAIIIDNGVLNGPNNKDVRKLLLQKSELLAVIELPESAFQPYASVQASIIFLKKVNTPNQSYSTYFAKAENVGRKLNGDEDLIYNDDGQACLNSDFPLILEKWMEILSSQQNLKEDFCYTADIHSTFNMDSHDQFRIDYPFHHFSRYDVRKQIDKHTELLLPLSDVCCQISDSLSPAKELPDQTILYTGLAEIEQNSDLMYQVETATNSLKSYVKGYCRDDILFSRMRPYLRKCSKSNFDSFGYCSAECIVLRVNKINNSYIIDPDLLSAILRSDFVYGQIVHLVSGIGRPRISSKELMKVMIPIPISSNSQLAKKRYHDDMEKIAKLQQDSKRLYQEAEGLRHQATNTIVNISLGEQNEL
jgi:type I restriction enzyme M protein